MGALLLLRVGLLRGVLAAAALSAGMSLAWAQGDPALMARGEKAYADKKCGVCHRIKGQGGKAGPDLSDVGARRDAPWLKAFIKDPKAVNPKSKMMAFRGSEDDLEALAAYLASLP